MDDIFNFEFLPPVIVFNNYPLSKVMGQLYDMEAYPIAIFNDKSGEVFKAANRGKPKNKKINIDCIILPIRYKIEFLA